VNLPKISISQRTTEPLFKAERPHEDFCINVFNVLRVNEQWHMWYTSYDHTYKGDADSFFCYACSNDGVHWERPDLGLVEYNGNRRNNILIAGRGRGFLGPTVFHEEMAPLAERFKMVCAKAVEEYGFLVFGGTSTDGLQWKLGDNPLLLKNSDTQTVCFRDGDLYRLYVRMWSDSLFKGTRIIGYSESKRFGEFSDPVVIMGPDAEDPADLQFYGTGTSKLAEDLYIMFPQGYYTGTDHVRCHVALSRDGKNFQRVGRQPLIDLGTGFDRNCVYVAPGVFPAEAPGSYWVYYLGTAINHDENWPAKAKYSGGIGRFLLTVAVK
jgi:hypothetical protein